MEPRISDFLPYLLNQAAEVVSIRFQPHYRERYGMLRTEWRVLFHLGQQGAMTARDICTQSIMHKTKVSRAVRALQKKGFIARETSPSDRRVEILSLTARGKSVFADLSGAAAQFEADLVAQLSESETEALRKTLTKLIGSARR